MLVSQHGTHVLQYRQQTPRMEKFSLVSQHGEETSEEDKDEKHEEENKDDVEEEEEDAEQDFPKDDDYEVAYQPQRSLHKGPIIQSPT
ncbi:hypothetical protein J1N35_041311 [Gossypium stocksii]|uniref:Uncharacterized protein n=1 Tax=Gossypium stocksii TaxID=47602 RepID=A0A9D3ZJ96_9ROSI|nr:hypothetical protein J1N35_041311 [Gossypium stocksii]